MPRLGLVAIATILVVASGLHLTAQALDLDANPTWIQTARLTDDAGKTGGTEGSAASFGYFGAALDLDGSLLAVGTAIDACDMFTTVHIYRQGPGTKWSEITELVPSDGEYGDAFEDCSAFGKAVALDEGAGILAAGNPAYDKPGTGNADALDGAIYIFDRGPDGSWTEAAKLEGPDDRSDRLGAEFGRSIDIDGTTIAVGAPFEDRGPGLRQAGAVYIVSQDDGTWSQAAELAPDQPMKNAQFGLDVALSGEVIAIGAPAARSPGGDGSQVGAVYLFERDTDGAWNQIQHVTAPDFGDTAGPANDCFGTQLALDGTTLVIGDACWDALAGDLGPLGNHGQAYVYERGEDGWILSDALHPLGGTSGSAFGGAVGIEDGTIVVGAPWEGHPARSGGAYVFQQGPEGWIERDRLAGNDTSPQDHFGWAVDISHGKIVVAAPFDDNRNDELPPPVDDQGDIPGIGVDNGEAAGTVYVFQRSTNHGLLT